MPHKGVIRRGRLITLDSWRFLFCVMAVIALFSAHAMAQTGVEDGSPQFSVSNILVDGPNPLSAQQTDAILNPYLNRQLDLEELRAAATAVENELAKRGHNFYRAELPPQTLQGGQVRLEIKRINISQVNVVGNQFFSADNIKRSLPLVAPGNSPNTQQIANALLLAEDNPAKDIKVVFVKGLEPQTVDANISVADQNPNQFTLWANNSGSRETEDSRIGAQYHNRNLWDRDHQLSLSYTTSPQEPSELQQYGINYRFPIFSTRGMANAFYSNSDADSGRVADVFDVSGAGETFGVGYTHYLDKRGDYQHRLGVDVVDKLFDSDVLFSGSNIGEDVRSRPLTIEYIARLDGQRWLFNGLLSHSSNLSGGNFNNDTDYGLVRAGADSSWQKQNLSLRLDYRFNRDWNGRANLFTQFASDPLIKGEQFGFGGALGNPGPRGFYEREVTVDEGIKGSFELVRAFPTRKMRLGVFFDFANGDRNNPQVGESADESLSSAGISFIWNIRTDISLNLDYGYILDGIDQTFTPGASDDGDSRLHVSLRYFPRWPWGNK